MLLVIDGKLPIEALNTYLFTSQPWENMFRIARSLSDPYSSVTNFSVKSFLKRCEKISIVNSLKTHEGQNEKYRLHFPQHHKNEKNTREYATRVAGQMSLTYDDLEGNNYSLSDLSRYVKSHLSKSTSRLVDHIRDDGFGIEDSDSDSTNDTDDKSEEGDEDDSIHDEDDEITDDYDEDNVDDEDKATEDEEYNLLANDPMCLGRTTFKLAEYLTQLAPNEHPTSFEFALVVQSNRYINKQRVG